MVAKKLLKPAIIVAVISVVMALVSIILMQNKFPSQSIGETLFAKTYDYGTKVNKIKLSSKDSTITLLQKNGYWGVEEADGYYSRLELVNSLLLALNNTTFYSKIVFSKDLLKNAKLDESGVLITTFADNIPIDEIIIGKNTKNSAYTFVRKKDSKEIWTVEGQFLLPTEFYSWIMQPVIELPIDIVQEISDGTITIGREEIGKKFRHQDNSIAVPTVLLNTASKIFVENVKKETSFDVNSYSKQRIIKFTLFPGLIIEYHLFYTEHEYWLKINLDKTPLPKKVVSAYIRDNEAFYNDWYFKLPKKIGRILSLTPLR